MENLFRCPSCNRLIIAEECETHQCKQLKGNRFEGNIVWVSDGERWYPLKLPTRTEQPDKTTNKRTEP